MEWNLHLNAKDFVTVIGGNGAGKSTMLNMIAGVYPIDEGRIVLNGRDMTKTARICKGKILKPRFPGSYDGDCFQYAD